MEILDKVINELEEVHDEYLESWAAGAFTSESVDETAQMNARALGKVQMLEEVVALLRTARAEYDDE